MNEQQRIGFENLLAEAQRLADAIDRTDAPLMAGERLRRELVAALAGGPDRLSAIGNWAAMMVEDDACPDKFLLRGLRDDAEALRRWIEGRL
jgi:hypothetical protein